MTDYWHGRPIYFEYGQWRWSSRLSVSEREVARIAIRDNGRLREGLRRLINQDYDSGYTAESYADAILSGYEPNGEPSIDGSTP